MMKKKLAVLLVVGIIAVLPMLGCGAAKATPTPAPQATATPLPPATATPTPIPTLPPTSTSEPDPFAHIARAPYFPIREDGCKQGTLEWDKEVLPAVYCLEEPPEPEEAGEVYGFIFDKDSEVSVGNGFTPDDFGQIFASNKRHVKVDFEITFIFPGNSSYLDVGLVKFFTLSEREAKLYAVDLLPEGLSIVVSAKPLLPDEVRPIIDLKKGEFTISDRSMTEEEVEWAFVTAHSLLNQVRAQYKQYK
jgi:hypothetical protein